jgi:hypothetical protein
LAVVSLHLAVGGFVFNDVFTVASSGHRLRFLSFFFSSCEGGGRNQTRAVHNYIENSSLQVMDKISDAW